MIDKARLFLKESRQELKRVNWPSRNETLRLTIVVVIMSLIVAAFLGLSDYLLSTLLKTYLL